MLSFRTIKNCLKYPLMWVMLLWALTLPGHEVAFYSFIMKGTVAETTFVLEKETGKTTNNSLEKQALQAFQDAKISTQVIFNLQSPVARYLLQVYSFAPPADEEVPACAINPAGTRLLAHIFPITILPNAP